jgi:LmbE family N-acetylglucosaminyl deacetylase
MRLAGGVVVAVVAAVVSLAAAWPAAQISGPSEPPPQLPAVFDHSTRLLVISPHPDDETLGAGGLMQRVIEHGGSVHVVWVTSGDGFPEGVETEEGVAIPRPLDYRSYGNLREKEARAAVGALGVPRQSLSFLGFPDEGICELASTYLSAKAKARAFESPYTDRESPPRSDQMVRGVWYLGVDVRRELESAITAFSPTIIATVDPQDEHPDHCSTYIFVREALDALVAKGQPRPRVLEYLIHFRHWPLTSDGGSGTVLSPPADFPPAQGRWVSLALTPDEIVTKKQALLHYHSQLLVMGRFVMAFARDNELFIDGEPASLPACWCQNGENVAAAVPPALPLKRPPAR